MNRAKWIKEIIGGAVEEHGFEYKGYSRDEYTYFYSYRRMKKDTQQDVWQTITIGVSLNEMELVFGTDAFGQDSIEAGAGLIESDFEIDSDNRWITWKDAEEFKKVLYHFREIILKKGLNILEEISIPTSEIRSTKETDWKLYQEHEALNEEYRKRYGLENIKSTRKLMEKISDIIVDSWDKEFAEVEELLAGFAAVYGTELVKKLGGEWIWDSHYNTCVICNMDGMAGTVNPLSDMVDYWKYREDDPEPFIEEFQLNPLDIIT